MTKFRPDLEMSFLFPVVMKTISLLIGLLPINVVFITSENKKIKS